MSVKHEVGYFEDDVVYIYAFLDATTGEHLYVGQAVDPQQRKCEHLHRGRSKIPARAKFVILRKCAYGNVSRIESQIIRSLKRKGECRLNRSRGSLSARKARMPTYEVRWPERGISFTRPAQAARYFGISKATVCQAIKGGREFYDKGGHARFLVRTESAEPCA
jgi:hypothetical protein